MSVYVPWFKMTPLGMELITEQEVTKMAEQLRRPCIGDWSLDHNDVISPIHDASPRPIFTHMVGVSKCQK